MRLCVGFTFCDNAADLTYKGHAWCSSCAFRRYGASVGLLAAMQLQEFRADQGYPLPARPMERPSSEGHSVRAAGPLRAASVGAVSPAAPFADLLGEGWTLNDVEFLTELYEAGER